MKDIWIIFKDGRVESFKNERDGKGEYLPKVEVFNNCVVVIDCYNQEHLYPLDIIFKIETCAHQ